MHFNEVNWAIGQREIYTYLHNTNTQTTATEYIMPLRAPNIVHPDDDCSGIQPDSD